MGRLRPDKDIKHNKLPGIIKREEYFDENSAEMSELFRELKEEPTLIGALSGEGILLYGKPITVSLEDMELKSKMIIAYDTSKLDQNTRSKLNRALYGGKSTYLKDNKKKLSFIGAWLIIFGPKGLVRVF